jgi:hypothetical protein
LEIYRFNQEKQNSDLCNDEDKHTTPEGKDDLEIGVDDDLTLANLEGVEPEDSKDSYTSDLCRKSLAKVSPFIFYPILSSIIIPPNLMNNKIYCIKFWQFL